MAKLEITEKGLQRLDRLDDLTEPSEAQFAELTILRNLADTVTAEASGIVGRMLPDSLEAEGNQAINKILREGSARILRAASPSRDTLFSGDDEIEHRRPTPSREIAGGESSFGEPSFMPDVNTGI